jgi:putative tryptophan/tyrosine transport system substrate-binding protein
LRATALLAAICLGCAVVVFPLTGDGQPHAKVRRIGFLSPFSASGSPQGAEDAFREGLRALGHVEGQDFAILWQRSEGYDGLRSRAIDLARLKVDVVVTVGTLATRAAKEATAIIPIVLVAVGDPVATGLVASLSRPGFNVTGLSMLSPELGAKRLELLKEAVPTCARVALLWTRDNPFHKTVLNEIEVAAPSLGVHLQPVEARGPDEFERAFAAIRRGHACSLLVFEQPTFGEHKSLLIGLAAKSQLPTIFPVRHYVDAGGLLSYGPSVPDIFRRAAGYVDKILKGAKPAELPIEQPSKFELVINLKTAQALGIIIPQSLLVRADEVIR